jgi:hypothetical protein
VQPTADRNVHRGSQVQFDRPVASCQQGLDLAQAGVVQRGEVGLGGAGGVAVARDAGQRVVLGAVSVQQSGQVGDRGRVGFGSDARLQALVFGPAGDDVVGEVLDEPQRPDQQG